MTDAPVDAPALSVILISPDRFTTLRQTVEALRQQAGREQIELVFVAPRADALELDQAAVSGFAGVRVVESGAALTGAARAAGIRAAGAPVVALAEDHSFPRPGWAAALIAAHRGPWAAVGVGVENANPASVVSWAGALLDFGPWLDAPRGPAERLPWHSSAYKRDLLLSYGARLAELLQVECLLQRALRADGYTLYHEPAARTRHLNIAMLRVALVEQFHSGRLFGALRAADDGWPALRRALYVAAAPLIPAVRLVRLAPLLRRPLPQRAPLPRLLPVLCVLLAAHSAGEATGYALGAGRSGEIKSGYEFHRERWAQPREWAWDASG